MNYQTHEFTYQRCPDQTVSSPARHPVVIVGAGPVGLALAIDLAQRGQKVVVLDDDFRLSSGSRAICFAKRTLEIFDTLGIGDQTVAKGVSWNVGKVFHRDALVYQFNLLPEPAHKHPAFINLQQYYAEGFLAERAAQLPNIELRWKNRVVAVDNIGSGTTLTIDTPDGEYAIIADYCVACDGSRSPIRKLIGEESKGQVFKDRFLIADVKMTAPFPTERWFWFDPTFHPNQSVLLHKQPDDVWRIDFQLGWDADPEEEKKPERVIPRVQALLGKDVEFKLEWVSVYTFACTRMPKFRHGRLFFCGDSAHLVSPFGARGANSGIQDSNNLGWKLDAVLRGIASNPLLESYATEREFAADENILNSTRSTDFITPKSEISRLFRDAALSLAKDHAFARRIVNSGRLSLPSSYLNSSLNTLDEAAFDGGVKPGAPALDAPISRDGVNSWFMSELPSSFACVVYKENNTVEVTRMDTGASQNFVASTEWISRYDAAPGTTYLFRPDHHVAARWRARDASKISNAVRRALGQ
ncbi:MAG: FAD-dependent oxidoreductase [Betaproteobacteria bacterium]|nr:MAG: FAD-dependent oxidoreductase [Betaproteobacteria bacterium]